MTRARLWELLDGDHHGGGWDRLACRGLLAAVVLTVVLQVLNTVPTIHARYDAFIDLTEKVGLAIFALEYIARGWAAPSRSYLWTPTALVDLAVVLGFLLPLLGHPELAGLRALAVLKLFRYTESNDVLARIVYERRRELSSAVTLLLLVALMASIGLYYAEHAAQPDKFASIPASAWWAVVTITTVGYGDVYPVTTLGKALGGLVALAGIGTFALPTAILGSAYLDEVKKQEAEPRTVVLDGPVDLEAVAAFDVLLDDFWGDEGKDAAVDLATFLVQRGARP